MACNVYCEHVGQYLHEGGNIGEINRRYNLIGPMTSFRISANTAGFSGLVALDEPTQRSQELLVQLLEGGLGSGGARRDHEVQITRELLRRRTKDFLQTPSHLIAPHRGPNLLGDREAQSRFTYRVRQGVNGEQPSSVDRTLTIDPLKLG